MSINYANKNYTQAAPYIKQVEDCVTGEPAIKAAGNQLIYLPSPACSDADPTEAQERYSRYVCSAEFDGVPSTTLEALLGGLSHKSNNYEELPDSMSYIVEDADGDGLSLDEMIGIGQAELLKMKFCGYLAEYSDLAGMGINDEQLTRQQVKALGLRSSIKFYPRSAIINWEYRRVNGVKQLSMITLREVETDISEDGLEIMEAYSYLRLALDENGNYYQQKRIEGKEDWSEAFYPETPSGPFNFIPFEFAIQGNYPKGALPDALGYLQPICSKTLARYNVNAQMKEASRYASSPFTVTSGWTNHSFNLFKEMNDGRDYLSVESGAHWTLPEGVTAEVLSFAYEKDFFTTYLERNAKEIRALGGAFEVDMQQSEKTATAAVIESAERLSVLSSLQSGLEKTFNRLIKYCAMFEGQDIDANIKLNREFIGVKLTPQERDGIRNDYIQGLISRDEALRQLEQGGVLTVEAKALMSEIDMSGE